jgi:hypothetical protein
LVVVAPEGEEHIGLLLEAEDWQYPFSNA